MKIDMIKLKLDYEIYQLLKGKYVLIPMDYDQDGFNKLKKGVVCTIKNDRKYPSLKHYYDITRDAIERGIYEREFNFIVNGEEYQLSKDVIEMKRFISGDLKALVEITKTLFLPEIQDIDIFGNAVVRKSISFDNLPSEDEFIKFLEKVKLFYNDILRADIFK